jgi:hypothetical protein
MFWSKASDFKRPLILHYHIFKNAGTTVESILQRNFRERFASFDRDDHNSVISDAALLDFLETRAELAAVSSHHLRLPKPVDERYSFFDVVFLRHPIARLWSTYVFYRRMDLGRDPLAVAAQTRAAAEFFELLMQDYPEHACNAQVNLIANKGDRIPAAGDLSRAIEILKQVSVLGVAEHFQETAVLAEHSLRPIFKDLDFSYVAQNVTDGRPKSIDEQLTNFAQMCGKHMLDELQHRNQLDLSLLSFATEELTRRFDRLRRQTRRLANLRARCGMREREVANTIAASNHPYNFALYASSVSN